MSWVNGREDSFLRCFYFFPPCLFFLVFCLLFVFCLWPSLFHSQMSSWRNCWFGIEGDGSALDSQAVSLGLKFFLRIRQRAPLGTTGEVHLWGRDVLFNTALVLHYFHSSSFSFEFFCSMWNRIEWNCKKNACIQSPAKAQQVDAARHDGELS